jgi:hypothetical protein
VEKPTPMEISSSKERSLKDKKPIFSPPITAEIVKPRRPFTRLATKQHILVEDSAIEASTQQKDKAQPSKKPIDIIYIKTPHHESNPTFKRLKRQLKDARAENKKLKKENLEAQIKMKDMLDLYEETIDK